MAFVRKHIHDTGVNPSVRQRIFFSFNKNWCLFNKIPAEVGGKGDGDGSTVTGYCLGSSWLLCNCKAARYSSTVIPGVLKKLDEEHKVI